MGLSGLDIFKKLPKTNCKECGFPTCLAFAMKLAAGQANLDDCPYVTDEVRAELAEAAAPPIRGVTVGVGEEAFKVGEELVLFRHEKTFFNPAVLGVLVSDDMDEARVDELLKQAKECVHERVGVILKVGTVAVKCASGDAGKFKALVEKVKGATSKPLILMAEDVEVMKAALEVAADSRPLLYAATEANVEAMGALAKEKDLPLAVKAADLDKLAELSEKLTGMGLKDLVLDPSPRAPRETFKDLVAIRRAALNQKFAPFGFPTITFPCEETDDELYETVLAAMYICKYGGIVILSHAEQWRMYPLLVLTLNIYTDPQRPMAVDSKFYEIGNPDENSPVLVTTNFSLTYFIVSGEIEGSKIPAWLGVVDVDGQSVLTAWAAGKFVPETIAKFINTSGIADKVKHRKLIIPGYVAQISGELEEELPDWEIVIGTREAADLPAFLRQFSTT
ncbi:MAG: acetyl-CoA decarbonylase/synthase complex subunit gamma [Actinobacteria bacterium]|nr:acetyl-CoA decarbonylase/synthase complex subunit gamma [Actinomycetota bacterium]